MAKTEDGIISTDVFVYCVNNPINYVDSTGTDAIWIQEASSAYYAGHSGLMVQDDKGTWYYFYWGPEDESFSLDMLSGVKHGAYCVEVADSSAELTSSEAAIAALTAAGGKPAARAASISSTYYFEGDYTKTLEAAMAMASSNEPYKLLTNNCVQKTRAAFIASDSRFHLISNSPIPNYVAIEVSMLPRDKDSVPLLLIGYKFLKNLVFPF